MSPAAPATIAPRPAAASPRRSDATLHAALLVAAAAVLGLAAALGVRGETQVTLPVLGTPLPAMCAWRRLLGVACPGCGLTRAFVSLAHGDVAAAWRFNPVGLPLFALVAAQVPYRAAQLWRIARRRAAWSLPGLPAVALALAAGLLGQWVWRILAGG